MAAEAIAAALGQGFSALDSIVGSKAKGKLAEKQGFQNTTGQLLTLRQQREQQNQLRIQEQAKSQRTITIALVAGGVLLVIGIIVAVIIKNKK
jgi:uncharacterized protein YhaN